MKMLIGTVMIVFASMSAYAGTIKEIKDNAKPKDSSSNSNKASSPTIVLNNSYCMDDSVIALQNSVEVNAYSYDHWGCLSYHNEKRAIAFASVILNDDNQPDGGPANWKSIEADRFCSPLDWAEPGSPDPMSNPNPMTKVFDSFGSAPVSANGNAYTCMTSVYYTTDYQFTVCPDGTYVIGAEGYGVDLESPTSGGVFMWSEMSICNSDDGISLRDKSAASLADRRLDMNRIVRKH